MSGPSPRLPGYEREPYRTSLATAVVEAGVAAGKPYAVLEDTILYPEGGGQPADRGTLNGVAVLDVQKKDGAIRHTLASPVAAGPAHLRLDWDRRFDHMQQHTGQHLLSAVAQDRFGWETTAFHLGPEVSDVELAAASLTAADVARLEEAVAAEIRAAHPVLPRRVPIEEFQALPVRTRGLPEGFAGDVRLVEIAGVDLNTCGGTHLANTAEIEVVTLLSAEPLRGGTRVIFAAGGRARRRMRRHEERNAALR
ncbi:MAG: alanyl-tRNA editing protein, partial [Thermoanaerobaculia bacterium]